MLEAHGVDGAQFIALLCLAHKSNGSNNSPIIDQLLIRAFASALSSRFELAIGRHMVFAAGAETAR